MRAYICKHRLLISFNASNYDHEAATKDLDSLFAASSAAITELEIVAKSGRSEETPDSSSGPGRSEESFKLAIELVRRHVRPDYLRLSFPGTFSAEALLVALDAFTTCQRVEIDGTLVP